MYRPILLFPALPLHHRRNTPMPLFHAVMNGTQYLQPTPRRFGIIDNVSVGMNPTSFVVPPAVTASIIVNVVYV